MKKYPIHLLTAKQFLIIKDRIKRQNLLLESFAEFLGFRALWDNDKVTWKRIRSDRSVQAKHRRATSHANAAVRRRQGAGRHLRGHRP